MSEEYKPNSLYNGIYLYSVYRIATGLMINNKPSKDGTIYDHATISNYFDTNSYKNQNGWVMDLIGLKKDGVDVGRSCGTLVSHSVINDEIHFNVIPHDIRDQNGVVNNYLLDYIKGNDSNIEFEIPVISGVAANGNASFLRLNYPNINVITKAE